MIIIAYRPILAVLLLLTLSHASAEPVVFGGEGPHWWAVRLPPGLRSMAIWENHVVSTTYVVGMFLYDRDGAFVHGQLSAFTGTSVDISARSGNAQFGINPAGPLLGTRGWGSFVGCETCDLPDDATFVALVGGPIGEWTMTLESTGAQLSAPTYGRATYVRADEFETPLAARLSLATRLGAVAMSATHHEDFAQKTIGAFANGGGGHEAEMTRTDSAGVHVCPCYDFDVDDAWIGPQQFDVTQVSTGVGAYVIAGSVEFPS